MRIEKDNIEDVLIRAIREKGAMERMEALDRQMAAKAAVSRRRRTWLTSVAAASVLLVACTDASLRLHTRSVGYGYEFTEVSRGVGNIQNLLNDKQFPKVHEEIQTARGETLKELERPSYDDPDYITQLNTELQELDFLEAVAHLRQGKYFKARTELKAIARGGGVYSEDAGQLLRKML